MSRVKRPKTSGPSLDDEYQIWDFVYENLCQRQLYTDADESLFRQYLLNNPDKKWSITELMDYFNTSMLPSLYKCDLPAETVLGLYKALDIEITPHVETLLEKMFSATLRIDSDRCLHSFRLFSLASSTRERAPVATIAPPVATLPPASSAPLAPPGGGPPAIPEEERRRKQLVPSIPHDMQVSDSFERLMWKHIFDNYDRLSIKVLLSMEFWQEMIRGQVDMPLQSAKLLLHHFCSRMVAKLYMQRVEVEKRLRLYQMVEWEISQKAKQWFLEQDRTRVQLDSRGYITSWEAEPLEQKPKLQLRNIATWEPRNVAPNVPSTSSSASLPTKSSRAPKAELFDSDDSEEDDDFRRSNRSHLSRKESRSGSALSDYSKKKRVPFTETEQLNVWTYIYKKIRKSIEQGTEPVLPKGLAFWTAYVKKTGSSRTRSNWSSHFRKRMCSTLYEMKLPREQILFLYQNIDIKISDQVQKILERKFQVKLRIGHERQLLSWKSLHEDEEEESEQNEEIIVEESEDYDSTLPIGSDDEDDRQLNRGIDPRLVSSDEEEISEVSDVARKTPTSPATSSTSGTTRTLRTPRTPKTPSPTVEVVTSRISSGRGRSARRSIRGAPIPVMPEFDLDQDRQPDEEMDQAARPKNTQKRSREERGAKAPKTSKAPQEQDEMVSPSRMTLRQRPEVSPSKKTPLKKPETPVKSPNKKGQQSDHEEEHLEIPKVTEDLLEAIRQTLEEIDDDEAVDMISGALKVAFRKENWDESGGLKAFLHNSITTIIKSNMEGARRNTFLKNADRLVQRLLLHVENSRVYEQRATGACKALEEKLLKKVKREPEEED